MKKLLLLAALLALLCPLAHAELAGYDGDYQYVTLGEYPAGEAIVWRVLKADEGSAWLLSEAVLDARACFADKNNYRGWLESDLRAWLGGDFLATAFTPGEREALLPGADGDLATLLSADEYKDAGIGFGTEKSRLAIASAHALEKGVQQERNGKLHTSPYWMRTPSDKKWAQRFVMPDGKLGYSAADNDGIGVRPSVTVSLDMLDIAGGDGTQASPFILRSLADIENDKLIASGATPVPTQTPAPVITPVPGAVVTVPLAPGVTPIPIPEFKPAGAFPQMDESGFLPDGEPEFVYRNEDAGHWLYASQTLRVEIKRYYDGSDPKRPERWYEAEIYSRDGGFSMIPHMADKPRSVVDPGVIARANGTVFALNGDYYIYRVRRDESADYKTTIGIVVRDGVIKYDEVRPASWSKHPNLDTLALMPDGDMLVNQADQMTGKQLVEMGARDVLSFGPWLIRDGEINPQAYNYGKTDQPRIGIAMAEKGHYFCVMVEARIKQSEGVPIGWLAERFRDLGCSVAFNLDGGQTAVMLFMGEQINKIGEYDGKTNARTQNEILGIGYSDLVK